MRTDELTMHAFADSVKDDLQDRLSGLFPGITAEIQQVEKIQGGSYLGMRIDTGNGMAAPVFNLEPVYEEAQRTGSFDRILNGLEEKISEVLRDMPQIGIEDLNSYDQAKENLIMQVIPIKGNEERLAEMPHRNMEDMAVVYRVMMETGHTGNQMSYLITDSVMRGYGVTPEQLHADAVQNMEKKTPYSIRPLFNVLAGMNPFMMDEPMPEPDNTLFVATNALGVYGAGAIALPGFMEDAKDAMKGNFFVLPSSIHEVLLLKDDGKVNYHELIDMVTAINAAEVAPADRLTDNVYHYDAVERVFETAKHFAERQQEKEFGRGSVLKDLAENRQRTQEHKSRAHDAPAKGGVAL